MYRLPEGEACNIKLTDDMQAFIRDLVLQQPFTTIAAVGQELAVRFPDEAILNPTIARHLQNQLITTKIAGKDSHVPYERNRHNTIERRFQYDTWLVNLGQYSYLPVCATSSIPSFTGVHQRQVCCIGLLIQRVLFTVMHLLGFKGAIKAKNK